MWQGASEAGGRLIGGAGAVAPAGRPKADLFGDLATYAAGAFRSVRVASASKS